MKNQIHTGIYLLSLVFLFSQSFAQKSELNKVTGNWNGILELPTAKLELIFKISATGDSLKSTLDVPIQGAKDLPVSKTTFLNNKLTLSAKMIQGEFTGDFSSDSTITGNWNQRGSILPLILTKSKSITELKRPQTPKKPFTYLAEEVEYMNPISGLKLAGTLTIPAKAKNCPAVVLISGSGAQDRDETIFEHRPFFVIADYLTQNGIAVLRVDDRGVGGSEGNIQEATSEDFASDVSAGIEFLKTRTEINHTQIGLIGHSEGGLIAPIVASRSNDVGFIVLLAGPGIIGEQILYEQNDLSLTAAGMNEEIINQNRQLQKTIFDIILNEKDTVKQLNRLQQAYSGGAYSMLNEEQQNAIDAQAQAINTPWLRFFLTYDPYPVLTKVKCPVLALNGEKDVQVPAKSNLAAIEKAVKEGGNMNVKTMQLKNLNHLFQNCNTGTVEEYGEIEETISPEVLKIIKDWILKVNS